MVDILLFISAFIPIALLGTTFIKSKSSIKPVFITGSSLLGIGILSSASLLIYLVMGGQLVAKIPAVDASIIAVRFDTVSTTIYSMVSIIGLIVFKFSRNYLNGDNRQSLFLKRLLTTVALVQILVVSGTIITLFIAWVATSISLQSLINYYNDREETKVVVRKKFIIARISDLFLLGGLSFLYLEIGSTNLGDIFNALKAISKEHVSLYLELSAFFLVLAAIIKSVQIPFHGWILDVMEAPTPVSALLHAGILNAGPYLIVRFAFLMDLTTAPVVLLVFGGITALYGTIVFPSQPAIKTSLAYSSIGHMGFSLMICGLGLYSAALLHIIAHSFYKAHSFLSSGSAIDKYRLNQLRNSAKPASTFWNTLTGFITTCLIFTAIANFWGGFAHLNFQFNILGIIILAGVSYFTMETISVRNGLGSTLRSIIISGFVLLSFFIFENAISHLIESQIPVLSTPDFTTKIISIAMLMFFVTTIFYMIYNKGKNNDTSIKWETYRRNGFYLHLLFDRIINSGNAQLNR
ncbi:proton-conducting transporter transmembrane domain-containing protein [Marinigracilibium pacificum]|uniref:Probable inorganic carbon transporter subunit DabB n=1 Tax=Marinigracilibium pacificum TaxID=2729599 RepID=A0A848J7D1_9BACT|nr:proton-conducting transporter membrane subunit [Marinigracilibium pacificum]NMM49012.1 NADH/ubiquinone/plastoquinone (complex i) [Marinigracilibium pacificum]